MGVLRLNVGVGCLVRVDKLEWGVFVLERCRDSGIFLSKKPPAYGNLIFFT